VIDERCPRGSCLSAVVMSWWFELSLILYIYSITQDSSLTHPTCSLTLTHSLTHLLTLSIYIPYHLLYHSLCTYLFLFVKYSVVMSESKALPAYKQEAKVPITRELREQFLCPICRDTIENAHRVFPCLREWIIQS
jgi:hypothetical protein